MQQQQQQRYKSTRGGTAKEDILYSSFEEALFSGYAPDGGLFVPVSLPCFRGKTEQFVIWSAMTFPQLAYDVLVRDSFYLRYLYWIDANLQAPLTHLDSLCVCTVPPKHT